MVLRYPAEIDVLRTAIEDARGEAMWRAAALAEEFDEIVESGSLTNTDDEHDPDGSTIAYERAKVAALRQQAERTIEELDRAEAALVDGTYGTCTGCGELIPSARLMALPATRTCVVCAAH